MAVALALAAGPRGAAGFAVSESDDGVPLRWPDGRVRYHVDPSGGTPVPLAGFAAALDAAFAHWGAVEGSPLDLVAGAPAPGGFGYDEDGDNASVVRWEMEEWAHEPEALALTFTTYRVADAAIVDADILVNAVDHQWTTSEAEALADPARHDVQTTLTHEAGHFLGLAHSADHPEAVMFPTTAGAETRRALADDDVAGFGFLYVEVETSPAAPVAPAAPAAPAGEPGGGAARGPLGCSAAGGGAPGGGALLVAGLGLLGAWRGRRPRGRGAGHLGLLGLGLLVAAEGPAAATVLRYVGVADLAASAELVVHGRVSRVQARRVGRLIVTDTTVAVTRCLRGACGAAVVVRQLGGEVGGVGLRVEGGFRARAGEEVVLFLRRGAAGTCAPLGMLQGALRVERGGAGAPRAVRDLRGASLVRGGVPVPGARETLALDELVALVRRR